MVCSSIALWQICLILLSFYTAIILSFCFKLFLSQPCTNYPRSKPESYLLFVFFHLSHSFNYQRMYPFCNLNRSQICLFTFLPTITPYLISVCSVLIGFPYPSMDCFQFLLLSGAKKYEIQSRSHHFSKLKTISCPYSSQNKFQILIMDMYQSETGQVNRNYYSIS